MDYATIPADVKYGTGRNPDGEMSVLMKIGEMVLMMPLPIAKASIVAFQKAIERAEERVRVERAAKPPPPLKKKPKGGLH